MELNAEKIKKALECCNTIGGCKVCPYSCNGKPTDNGECGEKMLLDALTLINSQEQRIKELAEENEGLRGKNTVCEVIELIKSRGYAYGKGDVSTGKENTLGYEISIKQLDQIAKEMLEGE